MALDTYIAGRRFESLLHKVDSPRSVNASKSLLENALTMEQGKTYAKHLGSSEKQFREAQKKLIQTLEKLQKKHPYNQAEEFFDRLSVDTTRCNSAICLNEIVENALIKANSLDNSGNW